jgi:hypothetical protein
MPKKPQQAERLRKIGQREERIPIDLTPAQREKLQDRVCRELIPQRRQLEARLKEIKAEYSAKIKAIQGDIDSCVERASTGRDAIDVVVEELLGPGNQVLRMRTDTGEQIGTRVASQSELQEDFEFDDEDSDGEAFQ